MKSFVLTGYRRDQMRKLGWDKWFSVQHDDPIRSADFLFFFIFSYYYFLTLLPIKPITDNYTVQKLQILEGNKVGKFGITLSWVSEELHTYSVLQEFPYISNHHFITRTNTLYNTNLLCVSWAWWHTHWNQMANILQLFLMNFLESGTEDTTLLSDAGWVGAWSSIPERCSRESASWRPTPPERRNHLKRGQ